MELVANLHQSSSESEGESFPYTNFKEDQSLTAMFQQQLNLGSQTDYLKTRVVSSIVGSTDQEQQQ